MALSRPPLIDMSTDGTIRTPRRLPLSTRLIAGAMIVAVVSGLIGVAALALWMAMMLIPIALSAGLVAWALLKWRAWRRGTPGRSLRWPTN